MSAVLQFCIDESEEVDQELLDILLTPLLPSSKAENPAAYNLVGGVLRRVTGNIQANISSFVNHVLVGTAPSMRENIPRSSDLSDHIYPLIYELHKISPGLLLRVLPNVCEQLKAEEEEVRLRAVKLLGRLFASTSAEYGAEFGRNFREFLNRFLDVSKAVREEMVDQCALVMKRKPDLRAAVEERMTERLRDAEFEVREGALKKLIEAGLDDPMSLSIATFSEMVERVKDKKETVHKTAIVGLAKIYGKFVASCLPDLSVLAENKETPESTVRQEIMDRLRTIPSTVCKYWGYPDLKNRHLVIHLLQEYLLPRKKGSSKEGSASASAALSASSQSQGGVDEDADIDASRASALLLMFSLLEDSERDIFGTILGFKGKVRGELQAFLEARKTATSASSGSRATMQSDEMLKGSMMRLYKIVPIDKKVQPLEKLHQMKDKTIYKLLQHALEPTDNITEGITSREELKQRLDSKSQLSEYVCIVFDFSSFFIANEGALTALLKYAMAVEPNEALSVGQLLSSLAKHVPSIFSIAAADIEEWVGALASHASSGRGSSAAKSLLAMCLKTIEVGGTGLAHDENSGSLCSALLQSALQHPDAAACEAFAKVASLLAHHTAAAAAESQGHGGAVGRLSVSQKKSESATVAAISNLASPKRLVMSNKRLHNDLLVLGALLRMPNRLGNSHAAKIAFAATVHATRKIREPVLSFVREDLFEEDHLLSKKDKEGEAARTQLLSAGLKVWAGLLSSEEEVKAMSKDGKEAVVAAHGGESIAGVSTDMNDLIATLFECIDSDGHQIRGCKLSGHTASILYATAATSAMNLIKIKAIGDGLSVTSWMKLAWTLLHPDTETRTRLAENLFDILQTCPVHSRFLTYPCLLAVDDRLHEHALRVIMFAVARLRRTHEILTQDAMADEDDEDAQRRAQDNMPETVLPFLLYLLSYHPEFPTSDVLKDAKDEKRLKHIVHIVRWTLRVLTESLGGEDNNLSFLIKQVGMISAYYDDTQDKDNVGLEYIMVLASKLLTELVKSDEHAVEYHGEIHLPMELYAPRPAARKVKKGSIETAGMDKVLSKDKKKGSASHHRPGGGAGRKRVAEVEDITDDEDDDEDKPKTKRAKKAAAKAKSPKAKAPASASDVSKRDPGIDRPRRQTTLLVSYREPTENDRETAEWEEQAAEKSNRSRTSIGSMSILGSLNSSSSSSASKKGSLRPTAFDEDEGEMDVESENEEPAGGDSRASAGTKRVSFPIHLSPIVSTWFLTSEHSFPPSFRSLRTRK